MADALFDRALELVMDAGQTLLENGGEVFRAQQTMEIMAASLGVRDFHVYVLTNGIFASAHLPGRDAVSLVRHVPTVSVHLGRVEAVNELSRELAAGRLGVVEAEARLNTARTLPRSTPQLEILACVVGSAGFAYLFGGTLADMPVAAVAGLLEALVCQQFARHGINRIFTDIVAAFCGHCGADRRARRQRQRGDHRRADGADPRRCPDDGRAGYSERRLPVRLHPPAGCPADCGQHCGRRGAGLDHGPWIGGGVMPVWTHYFAHFVVAVIATISFGITFQMPRRHYLACGLTGAVGWMVYIFGVELFALSPAIATLVATLPLTGCARFFAIRHKAPVTIFLLPGIFPLVPGAGIYYTAYYFLQGEQELFASKGGETFKVALALALGIALVCSLPLPGGHEGKRKS